MVYVIGPAVVISIAGAFFGSVASSLASAHAAAVFGRWTVWGVVVSAAGAVVTSIALPAKPMNIQGAGCPDMGSTPGHVLAGLVIAAVVMGVAVVASATVEGIKQAATGGTFARLAVAILVPYVALAAWAYPALCDYS
jgi:hypothetical protein